VGTSARSENQTMAKANRSAETTLLVPVERIEHTILLIRGQKVLLDRSLATLYGVPVRQLNQAVKRNRNRFPPDFMFQLTWEETRALRSQSVILGPRAHLRFRPYAFTEHGAVMLAAVLSSPVAVQASVTVVRAFVRLRELLSSNEQFRRKLDEIERQLSDHDQKITVAFDAIRQLMDESQDEEETEAKRKKIGYHSERDLQASMTKPRPRAKGKDR
jgi:hypothetical protein